MNVNSILGYKRDPAEDYYKILGCDRYSTNEQILTEFKIRAKECHPDKSTGTSQSNPEMFQKLLKAKNAVLDPEERKYYDAWLDSGITVSFQNWRGLKDTVKTSMHWATPKTDRMIKSSTNSSNQSIGSSNPFAKPECLPTQNPFNKEYDPSSVKSQQFDNSQSKGKNEIALDSDSSIEIKINEEKENFTEDNKLIGDDKADDGVTYDPTPYDKNPFRVKTPPPEWPSDGKVEKIHEQSQKSSNALGSKNETTNSRSQAKPSVPATNTVDTDTSCTNQELSMRRKQFASRRDSSIGAMVMTNKFNDNDIRRKFRNYEI